MLSSLKKIVEFSTGLRVFRRLPHGNDFFYDLSRTLRDLDVDVIFDVGANTGQSAIQFGRIFPKAQIFCFEPVLASFKALKVNTEMLEKIECFHSAVGDRSRTTKVTAIGTATSNKIIDNLSDDGETVPLIALDDFCIERNLKHISYLKIDTEGGDFNVVLGAERMLNEHYVDLVEVEAGMSPMNEIHVPLEKFKLHLESKGYFLFGFYEQVSEIYRALPNLRRANMVFISDRLIKG